MVNEEPKMPLATVGESRALWLFLIFAIPFLIALMFWLNGYLGK